MKKIYLLIVMSLILITSVGAQGNENTKKLIASGNSVFIEVVDTKNNTAGAYDSFKKHLLGEEWNRWVLVDSKDKANFICRITINKKGFNFFSFTSIGARVRVITEILTPDGKSVWKSKRQQGNVSTFTKGDALSDAMRKIIRRSLTEELYGETK